MKNMFKKAVAFGLALATCAACFASGAIYFEKKASMRVFSGRIEAVGSANVSDEGYLSLSIGDRAKGHVVGETGDIVSNETTFPVLVDAYHDTDSLTWADSNGKKAINAPVFTIQAVDGPVTGAAMRVEISGDLSAASAVHFGVYAIHYVDGREHMTRTICRPLDTHKDGVTDVFEIGDLLEQETVEIYVSAWISSYEFVNTNYTGGPFTAEAVFTYGNRI